MIPKNQIISLSQYLEKPSCDFQRADLLKVIKEKELERITFHYTAIDGRLKELKFPVSNVRDSELILAEGERVDGSSLFKGIIETEFSDLYVVPDYKTAFLSPFDTESLDVICRFLDKDGRRVPFALDNILGKASQIFQMNTGLELYALGELEFFLIREKGENLFPLETQKGYHESSPFLKSGDILNEMAYYVNKITGALKYVHSEVGCIDNIESELDEIRDKKAEQMELEFQTRPVCEMADILVLSRWIIRNVAFQHGCVATFTPKLAETVAGNGLHFHLELKKDGMNVMRSSDGKLSTSALQLIGGLCKHADSLLAFGNTMASSYMRLVPEQEAPTRICWSDQNRSALIRVPLAWANVCGLSHEINPQETETWESKESRQTVELRSPDGSALIHLLLAGIVMAAEWSFKDNLSLELAEKYYAKTDKLQDQSNVFPLLPASCEESSRILLENRNLYEREGVFPPGVIEYIANLLQNEEIEGAREGRTQDIQDILHRDIHRH